MGWSNYLIIPKLKIIFEIHRGIDELEEWRREALNELMEEEEYFDEMDEVKPKDLTLRQLKRLYDAWDLMNSLRGISPSELLMYFLESRDIKYEVKSEFDINLNALKEKGYKIITLWDYEEDSS